MAGACRSVEHGQVVLRAADRDAQVIWSPLWLKVKRFQVVQESTRVHELAAELQEGPQCR